MVAPALVAGGIQAGLGALGGFGSSSKKRRAARKRRAALFALANQIRAGGRSTISAGEGREIRFGEEGGLGDVSGFFGDPRELEAEELAILRAQAEPALQRSRATALGQTIAGGTTGLRTGNLFANPLLTAQAAAAQQADLGFQLTARDRALQRRQAGRQDFGLLFQAGASEREAAFRREQLATQIQLGGIQSPRGSEVQADFLGGLGAGLFSQGIQLIGGGGAGLFGGRGPQFGPDIRASGSF